MDFLDRAADREGYPAMELRRSISKYFLLRLGPYKAAGAPCFQPPVG